MPVEWNLIDCSTHLFPIYKNKMCCAACVLCKKKKLKANVNFFFGKRLGEDEAKSVTLFSWNMNRRIQNLLMCFGGVG